MGKITKSLPFSVPVCNPQPLPNVECDSWTFLKAVIHHCKLDPKQDSSKRGAPEGHDRFEKPLIAFRVQNSSASR